MYWISLLVGIILIIAAYSRWRTCCDLPDPAIMLGITAIVRGLMLVITYTRSGTLPHSNWIWPGDRYSAYHCRHNIPFQTSICSEHVRIHGRNLVHRGRYQQSDERQFTQNLWHSPVYFYIILNILLLISGIIRSLTPLLSRLSIRWSSRISAGLRYRVHHPRVLQSAAFIHGRGLRPWQVGWKAPSFHFFCWGLFVEIQIAVSRTAIQANRILSNTE